MLRYLRGKGILDVLYDGIRWLVPGSVGTVLAVSITLMLGLIYIFFRNHATVAKLF